ncbi:SDR family NAD(P)-dependent oxidoreductase [Cohnella hongkongensis]|uniref:SDR family NAD(P)-dependent oxidoreductase n=1 Tax=Cohnella hongkongensis TaxID=178337 RepID=A0ABV9FFW6_9BACL
MRQVLDLFSLRGKVAVVSGGYDKFSRQIGLALAQAGATTYVTSRDRSRLGEMERMYAELGCTVVADYLDVGDADSIEKLKERVLRENGGQVDILVNNAGGRLMNAWEDGAQFAESMRVYAHGLYAMTRAFGDAMAARKAGSIINIGSIHGMVGPTESLYEGLDLPLPVPDYFFVKGGMINFTRFAAARYGKHNVRCNCVSPGGLRSERNSEAFAERYGKLTYLGRMANDTDLMGVIVFLASDASLYLTGVNIPVDGGYTAQ